MRGTKRYPQARFTADVIKQASKVLSETIQQLLAGTSFPVANWQDVPLTKVREIHRENETWSYDTDEEFFRDYRGDFLTARFENEFVNVMTSPMVTVAMRLVIYGGMTEVTCEAPTRELVDRYFDVFEESLSDSILPETTYEPPPPTIFIGHGRNQQWRDLKDQLQDLHGYRVVEFGSGARAGMTIQEVLYKMLGESSFAVLVLTGEDETVEGGQRARQNVVHEVGLFQGRLGFKRAIMLIEDGVEGFTNVDGVEHITFKRGDIAATVSPVIAALRREFGT
jgi:hypothetical protein